MVKKLPKGENKFFFFFYNLFHIFSLSLRKNTKPLTFSALFITRNKKTVWENIPCKIFLFFFSNFLHPNAPRNRENYHLPFFSKFRLKVPKTAAKGAQVSFFLNYLFSSVITRTHTPTHTHSVFPTHNA